MQLAMYPGLAGSLCLKRRAASVRGQSCSRHSGCPLRQVHVGVPTGARPLPLPLSSGSALEVLAEKLQEKLQYAEGERDMIVLEHRFEAFYPEGRPEKITSTLIDYGIPLGETSMARTVGLPLAIAAKLILQGKIKRTGVQIPIFPEIYKPVLEELAGYSIQFKATRT